LQELAFVVAHDMFRVQNSLKKATIPQPAGSVRAGSG
jgi:hypothetical protein